MKKIIIISSAVVALSSLALNIVMSSPLPKSQDMGLVSVEALTACEVSSDPALNQGFCVKEFNGTEDVCVGVGISGSPNCSGNLK